MRFLNHSHCKIGLLLALGAFFLLPVTAVAQFTSGSDGSDGAFNPMSSLTIDLAQAGSGPGTGTYDAANWAVVFNYTTIDIPEGVGVYFNNHPSGAPVVWLASGDVTIAGSFPCPLS